MVRYLASLFCSVLLMAGWNRNVSTSLRHLHSEFKLP